MRTITLEEHFTTPEILAASVTEQPEALPASPFIQAIQAKLLDLGQGRIADMDSAGIDVQVLSVSANPIDKMEASAAQALARDTNDGISAAVANHPKRLAAFATLALHQPDQAASEFERCIQKLGFKGLMINGTSKGLFLDDLRFTPIFEVAQALDVPIYLHPAPPPLPVMNAYFKNLPGQLGYFLSTSAWGWHAETGMHCLRMMITGLFDRFPKLKMIIGHMGEDLPFSIARAESVFLRGAKHLKRPLSEYLAQHFYITTSGYFTLPPFLCALQVIGIDRLLFSVDYPFSPLSAGCEFLAKLTASDEDLEKIAYRNAEGLLRL